MARIDTLVNFLTDVAAAIKSKTGKTETIKPENFDIEIAAITSGGDSSESIDISYIAAVDTSEGELCTKLPDGITGIGDHAFRNKINLGLTELPDSIVSIGYDGFYQCTNLKLTKLPASLQEIGSYAFQGCSELSLTELPDNLKTVKSYAFEGCQKLALTKLPNSLEKIENYAFQSCSGMALSGVFPSALTTIGDYAFNSAGIGAIEIPDNVTSMGQRAFSNSSITSIKLGTGITGINMQCFASTSKLTKVTCYGDITSVSGGAFNGARALKTLLLPNVTGVPYMANDYTIYDCPLRNGAGTVYVPDDLVDAFKSAQYWSSLASNIKPISSYMGEI